METKTELNKCFIAKTSAFKVQLNSLGDCYFHAGKKEEQGDKWESRYGKLEVIWVLVGSYALVITVIKTK